MSVSRRAIYTRHPWIWKAKVDTAETDFTGSGGSNYVTLISDEGGTGTGTMLSGNFPNGKRISYFTITGIGTTTADLIKFWLTYGGVRTFWKSKTVAAATPGTGTEAAFSLLVPEEPLVLPDGWGIDVACHGGQDFWVHAFGADFEDED